MAVPKKRPSKARTRRRKSANMKLAASSLVVCSSCGNRVLMHRVCPKCGFYRGKQAIKPEELA